jgi:hypothetical protein
MIEATTTTAEIPSISAPVVRMYVVSPLATPLLMMSPLSAGR